MEQQQQQEEQKQENKQEQWVKLASPVELAEGARKRAIVNGRDITLFHHKGAYYALDSSCYHAGGPLIAGDITDIENDPCVVCPWHGFTLKLATGESLYYNMDDKLCSKGVKQRPHKIQVRPDDGVYVCVLDRASGITPAMESDRYAYMDFIERYKAKGPHEIVCSEDVCNAAPTTSPE